MLTGCEQNWRGQRGGCESCYIFFFLQGKEECRKRLGSEYGVYGNMHLIVALKARRVKITKYGLSNFYHNWNLL